ncbi:MAG: aminoacetone oxidase family FAD-binding enzyme [Bacteriovoracaceae bacterium]|nr:aminoacetone oxidase family FAD-binding enzyme [Bacteriovoracaceae bacterium]
MLILPLNDIVKNYDVIILGAGAAGLFCASLLNDKKTLVLEHNSGPGKKILISGGGRCNFTNKEVKFNDFTSQNLHFFKSALTRFPPENFVELVKKYQIPYYEKKLGQLFCKNSAHDILQMLMSECTKAQFVFHAKNISVQWKEDKFWIESSQGDFTCEKLVVATGGLSLPLLGASDLGHKIAKQFGHKIIPASPALVPFLTNAFPDLAGISTVAQISTGDFTVTEDILITHKGLSGPAILKASLYWEHSTPVIINWLPTLTKAPANMNVIKELLPKRLFDFFHEKYGEHLYEKLTHFSLLPSGTEGFRKAEVTKGGVDTAHVSSKTMESKLRSGLFFIGEVIDVTGQLGGYNFQWAWASAHAAAEVLRTISF